ncbi:hypothetical protein CRG98_036906, partial [Punica granatum]
IIEARKGNHLHRLAAYYGRLNRGTSVPPLSHFFPGPSRIIGGTLDGPSSDSNDTPAASLAVYAITEEIPSGVHIPLAQENEELDNWTSVSRYSAVIADCQSDQRNVQAHFRGILLKPGHPDPPRTPFLTELTGPVPLTSKRPLKAGLQAPKDHQSRGTSVRGPSETRLGFPRDVSVVMNVSRRAFGARPRRTEITTVPEHLTTSPEHLKTFREH